MTGKHRFQLERYFDCELHGAERAVVACLLTEDSEAVRHWDRLMALRRLAQRHDPAATVPRTRPVANPQVIASAGPVVDWSPEHSGSLRAWRHPHPIVVSVASVLAASLFLALVPLDEVPIRRVGPIGGNGKPAEVTTRPRLTATSPGRGGAEGRRSSWDVVIYGWANAPPGPPEQVAVHLLGHAPTPNRRRSAAREILALELANASAAGAMEVVTRAAVSLRPGPKPGPSYSHDGPTTRRHAAGRSGA
jgi:hypothetical protein